MSALVSSNELGEILYCVGCDLMGVNRLHKRKSIRQVIIQLRERAESEI